jgi:hypothetical protein
VHIGLLREELLRLDVVHEHRVEVVDDSYFLAVSRYVYNLDGCGLLDNGNGEAVVHEYLEDTAVLKADQDTLTLRRATDCLDIADGRVEHPLTLKYTREG